MRTKPILLLLLLNTFVVANSFAQEIPLVYDVENTGADCNAPPLPAFADLPSVVLLTDPFEWSDGSDRSTDFNDWSCRRAEIKAEIENYEIGTKPDRPNDINASYAGGILTVNVTVNGNTLTLTSDVNLPPGGGPFPAIIGMTWIPGSGSAGSLPADIFTSRNIAIIEYVHDQVTTYSNPSLSDPYFQLYPDKNLDNTGQYSAWSWGVSRLIDGLELVQEDLPIDLNHLAVTGCSYAGKMALFSGALDERIALTIAQESGGGGAAAWRVSETLGDVEKLGSTNHDWFRESMFQFAGSNVSKLPMDHHELMAMVAPRAFLALGNPPWVWLAGESGYVSCRAAHEVWKTFGIPERFGFSFVSGHTHCELATSQRTAVEAFVDRFLLDDSNANTNITAHEYGDVNFSSWFDWWATRDPNFCGFENGWEGWTNLLSDDVDWTRDSDGTPSLRTGPDSGANGSTWYVYFESGDADEGDVAILESPEIEQQDNRVLNFYYHMYGSSTGSLYVDVYDGSWHNGVWSLSGQQQSSSSAPYSEATVYLNNYTGPIKIRFRAVAVGGSTGDMAVDDISVVCNRSYGDFTADAVVDDSDLDIFCGEWLVENCNNPDGLDLDGNCMLNFYEYSLMAENWLE